MTRAVLHPRLVARLAPAYLALRCALQRDANAGVEASPGYDAAPDYQDHLSGVPCRFWSELARGEFVTADRDAVIEEFRLLVLLDVDVTETDQVTAITTPIGDVVHAGPFNITQILRRPQHQLLVLREVR